MLANKRQERILELLHQSGQVLVSTLAEELGVSDETIRRDIMTLHQAALRAVSTAAQCSRSPPGKRPLTPNAPIRIKKPSVKLAASRPPW